MGDAPDLSRLAGVDDGHAMFACLVEAGDGITHAYVDPGVMELWARRPPGCLTGT